VEISQADLASDNIIVGGDFNHTEGKANEEGSGTRKMFRREAVVWHQMTIRYGLTDAWNLDSFRKLSRKEFTFDNGRAGPRSSVSRLDKFMVSQEITERGKNRDSGICDETIGPLPPRDDGVGQPPPS